MELDVENSYYGQKAKKLFLEGYNCSQSVFLAFEDKYDMDHGYEAEFFFWRRYGQTAGGMWCRVRNVYGCRPVIWI